MKIFILIFCCVITLAAFWYGTKLIKLYLKVKNWQRTTAKVLKKEVVKRKIVSGSRAQFKPSINYSYFFDLKEYKGERIFLVEFLKGEKGFMHSAAEKFLAKTDPEVEIYVNPQNPEESVMFCDGFFLYIMMYVMGFMSLLIGLANYIS